MVASFTHCSVEDAKQVLDEIRRVLKPEGRYLFMEHTMPQSKVLGTVFSKVSPTWQKHMGNCKIDLDTHLIIEGQGFEFISLNRKYNHILTFGVAG